MNGKLREHCNRAESVELARREERWFRDRPVGEFSSVAEFPSDVANRESQIRNSELQMVRGNCLTIPGYPDIDTTSFDGTTVARHSLR